MTLHGEALVFADKHSALLRTPLTVHAFATLVVPLAGTAAALLLWAWHGVSRLDVTLFVVMYFATMLGGTVGFHRLLSHRAFQTAAPVRAVLIVLGCLMAQGTPIYWASNHRRHHQFSDQRGDPHSPHLKDGRPLGGLRGLWHAHSGWSFDHAITNPHAYCRDLLADPVVVSVNRLYFAWVAIGLALPAAIGGLVTRSPAGAVTALLWGGLVRLCVSYHATCSINSIAHRVGGQPFDTADESRNVAWLAIPTVGEAWHNNHHAFVGSPVFGLRWWQIDLGALLIGALEALGWAWNVRRPTPEMMRQRAAGRSARG
jgi:stearoyl-CoA desaturase (delta-9 desaturase)